MASGSVLIPHSDGNISFNQADENVVGAGALVVIAMNHRFDAFCLCFGLVRVCFNLREALHY